MAGHVSVSLYKRYNFDTKNAPTCQLDMLQRVLESRGEKGKLEGKYLTPNPEPRLCEGAKYSMSIQSPVLPERKTALDRHVFGPPDEIPAKFYCTENYPQHWSGSQYVNSSHPAHGRYRDMKSFPYDHAY